MSHFAGRPGTTTRVSLLALAYLGFISLGLPDGLLGVAWPTMRVDFRVPVEAVGVVLAVATTGYLLASVAAGFILSRVSVGLLLAVSTGLTGLALFGYGTAPALAVVAGAALALGLGSGAIDAGLNVYAARHFGPRHMNWLHAAFGLGATLGPLVMTGVLGAGLAWRWGYGVVAVAQGVLATAFALTARAWRDPAPADASAAAPPVAPPAPARGVSVVRLPAAWLGVLMFALYTGVEIGAGLWAFLLLTEARGVSDPLAGIAVSGYWGSLFVGRVGYGIVADRLRTEPVLTTCLTVMAVGAALLAVPGLAWTAVLGLILMGGFAAPVFPLLTLTTHQRVGEEYAARTIGMQMGAAGLGGAAIPAAVGAVLGRLGPDALGPALLAFTIPVILSYLYTTRG